MRKRIWERGICKQNEQSEDNPSDDSESQQDDEHEIPHSQSEFDPWNKLLKQAYDSLQDTFDETCETYLEQNPGMEIEEEESKTLDELKSNYRQALISN